MKRVLRKLFISIGLLLFFTFHCEKLRTQYFAIGYILQNSKMHNGFVYFFVGRAHAENKTDIDIPSIEIGDTSYNVNELEPSTQSKVWVNNDELRPAFNGVYLLTNTTFLEDSTYFVDVKFSDGKTASGFAILPQEFSIYCLEDTVDTGEVTFTWCCACCNVDAYILKLTRDTLTNYYKTCETQYTVTLTDTGNYTIEVFAVNGMLKTQGVSVSLPSPQERAWHMVIFSAMTSTGKENFYCKY